MVRLTDRPDMTLDVYRGRKTTIQPTNLYLKGKTVISKSKIYSLKLFIGVGRGGESPPII